MKNEKFRDGPFEHSGPTGELGKPGLESDTEQPVLPGS